LHVRRGIGDATRASAAAAATTAATRPAAARPARPREGDDYRRDYHDCDQILHVGRFLDP
jgi:hypothetical protein